MNSFEEIELLASLMQAYDRGALVDPAPALLEQSRDAIARQVNAVTQSLLADTSSVNGMIQEMIQVVTSEGDPAAIHREQTVKMSDHVTKLQETACALRRRLDLSSQKLSEEKEALTVARAKIGQVAKELQDYQPTGLMKYQKEISQLTNATTDYIRNQKDKA